ncbi:MAG TPA: DUF6763 family protein [Steroidobacteraceae bacterium]|nr:DUF6763 family protein [Steroidobacteraceae bacterium]
MNAIVGMPHIGKWYTRRDKGETFQVVGRDEESRAIEIQYFGGDVDEIEAATWSELPLEHGEPPEDWTAPLDEVESDDLGYSQGATDPAGASDPLHSVGTVKG